MKNKIFTNTDENKFAREVLPKQSGLFLVKGSIKLDDTHRSRHSETSLVSLTAGENWLHSLVICSQGAFFDDVKVWDIEDGAITEEKLDTALTAKVNNNVKTVAQTLTGSEVDIASKNLKLKDNYQNFFANRYSYESVTKLSVKPNYHIFGNSCTDNTFGTNCYYTTLGNNCRSNTFGNDCVHNILGDGCSYNIFGKSLECSKIDSGVTYIELRSNASTGRSLKNIHILSGVRGKSSTERLVINIPDEYLKSSRELIITTKRTDGGPSTPGDIVMYYADEVVDKQNKQDNTLATTSKEIVGAINELFNGAVQKSALSPVLQEIDFTGTNAERKAKLDKFEADWKSLTGASDMTGARFVGYYSGESGDSGNNETALSAIMVYDSNEGTYKGFTVDDSGIIRIANVDSDGNFNTYNLFSSVAAFLKPLTIKTGSATADIAANKTAIENYISHLVYLGLDTANGYQVPVVVTSNGEEYTGTLNIGTGALLMGIVTDVNETHHYPFHIEVATGIVTFDKTNYFLEKTSNEVTEMLDAIKYSYTPVPLTTITSTNKTQLDLFLSKVPNAQVMHCTYKDVYAGTLHKINGSWYGVLVGESNTLAGQLSIKLQADGTIVEETA